MARASLSKVDKRDPYKTFHVVDARGLQALMPGFDWTTWMKDVGVAGKVDSLIVSQPSYLAALDKIIAAKSAK